MGSIGGGKESLTEEEEGGEEEMLHLGFKTTFKTIQASRKGLVCFTGCLRADSKRQTLGKQRGFPKLKPAERCLMLDFDPDPNWNPRLIVILERESRCSKV